MKGDRIKAWKDADGKLREIKVKPVFDFRYDRETGKIMENFSRCNPSAKEIKVKKAAKIGD